MRSVFAFLFAALLVSASPVPGFALASPPADSGNDSEGGQRGNRILTLFNLAGSDDEEDEVEEEDEDDPRSFTMPTVVAPLSREGRLTGFAYVQIRVRIADGQNIWSIRDDAHYALDAAVRAAYRNSVSNVEGSGLDVTRAVAVWQAALAEHYGPRAIERVEIRNADTRLFRR
ncbi:hypothetical protein AWH62_05085 [Maricaulis sp. W15]|uniref:hypothetical protein n=1 Tax=Maricaulis sp. W15 TaxID=1772333 RepID=UPI000948F289|nr:hypothetical protein [Maricaulis sp. W15]OLF78033.1 hypothetical protein AWH62_05085 [Maricaulis sp. W15]